MPGPELVQPVEESAATLDSIHQVVERLLAQAARPRVARTYEASLGGQTDANGHLQILLYQAPAGFDFYLYRVVLDMVGATPQAPVTTGYVQVCNGFPGALGVQAASGTVRDFAPTSAGGQVFPQVSTDGDDSAAVYRGGETVYLNVVGTTASKQVACYIKGLLVEQ